MKSAYTRIYKLIAFVALIDLATINITYLCYLAMDLWLNFDPILFTHTVRYGLALNLAYVLAICMVKLSVHRRLTKPQVILRNVSRTVPLTLMLFISIIGMAKMPTPGFWKSMIICFIAFIVISTERMIVRHYIKKLRNLGRSTMNCIIIGYSPAAEPLIGVMKNKWNGLNLMGIFCDEPIDEIAVGAKYLGKIKDSIDYMDRRDMHDAFIYRPLHKNKNIKDILNACYRNVVRVYYIPEEKLNNQSDVFPISFGDSYLLSTRHEPLLEMKNQIVKRTMDVVLSLLFLCTLYPIIYIIVALITKLTNPGPVYFKQERTGYDGKSFLCMKFRSMKVNKDADKKQATANDSRVTKFGHILRHYNIDELPQVINVLKGDMSIVGPRPHMLAHTEYYGDLINDYMIRHFVRPGITGLAQVSGFRGETKTVEEMKARVEKDIEYIETWSFWQDVEIMIRTVTQILHGDKKAY